MKIVVFEKSKERAAKMKRRVLAVAGTAALTAATALPVLASTDTSSMEDAVITSMTATGSSMTSMVSKAVPIVMPIIGGVIVVMFGIKLFRKLTGKV